MHAALGKEKLEGIGWNAIQKACTYVHSILEICFYIRHANHKGFAELDKISKM